MIDKYCALKLYVFLRDSGGVKWWEFVSSVALIVFLVLYTIKPIKVGEALIKWKEKNIQTADKKSVEAVIFNENHVKFFNDHINGKQCSVLFLWVLHMEANMYQKNRMLLSSTEH